MVFSGALMEGLCLSYDIAKGTKNVIFSNNPTNPDLYKLDYKNLAVFVRDYLRIIKENPNLEISIKEFKFPNDSIYGMNLVREGSDVIDIYLNSELNECWSRFVICKELIQLYLDSGKLVKNEKSYPPNEIIEQIKEATVAQQYLNKIDKDYKFSTGFSPEALAYIIVTDLFFPLENKRLVKKIGTDVIDKKKHNFTHYDLASLFKTPEHITRFYRAYIEEASLVYLEDMEKKFA